MGYAVCYEHEVFGSLEDIGDFCNCSIPNPKYPDVRKVKIPDEFEKVVE